MKAKIRGETLKMNNIKWIFVLFSILAAASIMGIGIAISEKSIIIGLFSILILFLTMGIGMRTKSKWRKDGKL